MTAHKECEGCSALEPVFNSCKYAKLDQKYLENCPCYDCVVKIVCHKKERYLFPNCRPFIKMLKQYVDDLKPKSKYELTGKYPKWWK